METSTNWDDLWNGTLSEDTDRLLISASEQLDHSLQVGGITEHEVLELIAKRLSPEVGPDTWSAIGASLTSYLSNDPANLIAWVVATDQSSRIERLERHSPPRVISLLRSILGHFGTELETSYAISNAPPHDWRRLEREVLQDIVTEKYTIRTRILKFGGDELFLECSPSSFASLVAFMLESLRMTGKPSTMDDRTVAELAEAVQSFQQFLSPMPSPTPAMEVAVPSAAPSN